MSKIRIIEDSVTIPIGLQNVLWSIFLNYIGKNSDIYKYHVFKIHQQEYALEVNYEVYLKPKEKKPSFKQKYLLPMKYDLSDLGNVIVEVNGDIYTMKMK